MSKRTARDQTEAKLRTFLFKELARKEGCRCTSIDLLYVPGKDYHDEAVRSWTYADYPEIFENLALIDQLVPAIIAVATDHQGAFTDSRRYIVRTIQHFGDRQTCSFKLPVVRRTGRLSDQRT